MTQSEKGLVREIAPCVDFPSERPPTENFEDLHKKSQTLGDVTPFTLRLTHIKNGPCYPNVRGQSPSFLKIYRFSNTVTTEVWFLKKLMLFQPPLEKQAAFLEDA